MKITKIVRTMNPLAKVDYTKLTWSQIVDEVTSIIKSHPKYKTEWQDFLESNAGQMLLETFAFIAQKIIMRADFIANELFLPTAEDPASITNILKLIGYSLKPPSTSKVKVTLTAINEIPIQSLNIPACTKLLATNLSGEKVYFEIMAAENDYDNPIEIPAGAVTTTVWAWQGETRVINDIIVDKPEEFSFEIPSPSIIDGSIKVSLNIGTRENPNWLPLEKIDSLLLAGEDKEYPRYSVSYNHDFSAIIQFGKKNFGGAFKDIIEGVETTYKQLKVEYRVGGGSVNNITAYSIKEKIKLTDSLGHPYIFECYNTEPAVGGTDGEDLETAKKYAPLTVKTVDKTVTKEDYVTLLKQQNELKVINASIDSPYENPLEVPYLFNYIYVLPYRNWQNFLPEDNENVTDIRFAIPVLKENETKELYKWRFQIRLNNFLNLRGFCDPYKFTYMELAEEEGYSDSTVRFPLKTNYTDEAEILYNYLKQRKITGIENIFKVANFIPFRIEGTLYYKSGFNAVEVRENVINALRKRYAIENMEFGENIVVSQIYALIHEIEGVSYFQMYYPTQNLIANINEIYFLLPENIVSLLPNLVKSDYDIVIRLERV